MPPRRSRIRVLATLLVALTILTLGSAPAPARAASSVHHKAKRKQRKAKRCKRGRIRVRTKGSKRVRCVKRARRLPRGSGPAVAVRELRPMLPDVPLRARRHRHGRHLPKSVGKAIAKYHLKPAVLERLLARTRLPNAFAASRAQAAFKGPSIDGWETEVELGDDGHVTATATKEGATQIATSADTLEFDACPDAQGNLLGRRTNYTRLLLVDKEKGVTRARIEINSEASAKFTAHVTDDLKVDSFDVDPFRAYVYVRGDVYDADGKRVLGTPPWLPSMSGGARGIRLGTVSVARLNAQGNGLSGSVPSSLGAGGRESFATWAQLEYLRSAKKADERLSLLQGHFDGCLDLSVSAGRTTLAPGESTTLTLRVSPHGGGALAPVQLDNHGGAGAVVPAAATTTGQPVQVTFTAPTSDWKGTTAYFGARSRQGGGFAQIALGASPANQFVLVFSHASHADSTADVDNPTFVGTRTHHEAYDLTARIPLSGDPSAAKASGAGAIGFTRAEYHDEQDGTFHGQGTCEGTDKTDLTAARGGTARVLGLTVSGSDVTLDFAPGAFGGADDGPPSETYRNVQTYDACPGADNTMEQALFLNRFRNQYDSSGWVYGGDQHVRLASGWRPGSGDVVATLDVAGPQSGQPNSSWTDHYEIDRVP